MSSIFDGTFFDSNIIYFEDMLFLLLDLLGNFCACEWIFLDLIKFKCRPSDGCGA
jgi:hypothetical protein